MAFRAPEAYEAFIGRYGPSLGRSFAAFAGVRAGDRVLDVGCGTGALAAVLTEGGAQVTGAEPSEPFAAAARERVPGVEVVVAPGEDLPFAADSFDAALSQLVVNFMRDPEAGVRESARVTRPGGVVAACVWDYGGGMTLLRAFWDAAHEVSPDRAAAADEAVVMRFCREGELAGLWDRSGLRDVEDARLEARAAYDSFADLWAPFPTGIGPAGAFCAALPAGEQEALHAALQRRLGVGDGPFELRATAYAARGRVP